MAIRTSSSSQRTYRSLRRTATRRRRSSAGEATGYAADSTARLSSPLIRSSTPGDCQMQEYCIVPITAGGRKVGQWVGQPHDLAERQIVCQQRLAFGRIQAEFRIDQDTHQFGEGFATNDRNDSAAGPGTPQPKKAPR